MEKNSNQVCKHEACKSRESSIKIPQQLPFKKTSELSTTNKKERRMIMAEKKLEHDMFIEKQSINGKLSRIKRGQIFGFIIVLIVIVCRFYLALFNGENIGNISLGAPLVSLIALFVIGKLRIDALKSK